MDKHHYIECGLDNVWICNGYTKTTDQYGEYIQIEDVDGLHKVIGQALVEKKARLSGLEVRFLRVEMNLSQKSLGKMLAKQDQSIANWEKGAVPVPSVVDYLIRHMYKQWSGQRSVYVEEVERLQSIDQQDYSDGFEFCENDHKWKLAK